MSNLDTKNKNDSTHENRMALKRNFYYTPVMSILTFIATHTLTNAYKVCVSECVFYIDMSKGHRPEHNIIAAKLR